MVDFDWINKIFWRADSGFDNEVELSIQHVVKEIKESGYKLTELKIVPYNAKSVRTVTLVDRDSAEVAKLNELNAALKAEVAELRQQRDELVAELHTRSARPPAQRSPKQSRAKPKRPGTLFSNDEREFLSRMLPHADRCERPPPDLCRLLDHGRLTDIEKALKKNFSYESSMPKAEFDRFMEPFHRLDRPDWHDAFRRLMGQMPKKTFVSLVEPSIRGDDVVLTKAAVFAIRVGLAQHRLANKRFSQVTQMYQATFWPTS
jgi:FtsZ-binding cell division protein ZapB